MTRLALVADTTCTIVEIGRDDNNRVTSLVRSFRDRVPVTRREMVRMLRQTADHIEQLANELDTHEQP